MPIFFGFRATGSIFASFFGGRIIERYGNQRVFFINMLLPSLIIFMTSLYNERSHSLNNTANNRNFMEEMTILKKLILREEVFYLVSFIMLINLTPSFDSLVTFYLTDFLKFDDEDLANFNTVGTICYVLGLLLYSFYFKNICPKNFYLTTNVLLWICNMSFFFVVLHILERFGVNIKIFCFFS